jgi:hypothetical protein
MKFAKKRLKHNLTFTMYENINLKWNKQGYDVRSYFKLVLKKLKIMKRITSILFFCELCSKKLPW